MNLSSLARTLAGALVLALAFAAPPSTSLATPPQAGEVILPKPATSLGGYRLATDTTVRIVLEAAGDPTIVRVRTSAGWGAIGFLANDHFEGVVRPADLHGSPLPGPMGTLGFDVGAGGVIRATLRRSGEEHTESWQPEAATSDALPKFGDDADVDELPQVLRRVAPVWPESARLPEGTVMIQALVGQAGTVLDTRIIKSVADLDAAAVAAVKQWTFKPAQSRGRPVAVWVAVPVRYLAPAQK